MGALAKYDAACRAIALAKSVDEAKQIRDEAEAMRHYARQANNRELEADAWEIRERAEIKLGELIKRQKETVGLAKGGKPYQATGSKSEPVKPTLKEAGIDKKLSSRSQKKAELPEPEREGFLAAGREAIITRPDRVSTILIKEHEIKSARAAYEARKDSGGNVEDLHTLAATGFRASVILADPPWEFKVYSGKGKQRSAERHYDTKGLDAIKALPVSALAAENCALFLWSVWPELPGALEVIEAWGFEYKTCGFLWVKQNESGEGLHTGMGYWTRANSEPCLFATKGTPQRLAADVHQIILSPVGEHSQKPREIHARIERLLAGPYLELYARDEIANWRTWGNEVRTQEAAE